MFIVTTFQFTVLMWSSTFRALNDALWTHRKMSTTTEKRIGWLQAVWWYGAKGSSLNRSFTQCYPIRKCNSRAEDKSDDEPCCKHSLSWGICRFLSLDNTVPPGAWEQTRSERSVVSVDPAASFRFIIHQNLSAYLSSHYMQCISKVHSTHGDTCDTWLGYVSAPYLGLQGYMHQAAHTKPALMIRVFLEACTKYTHFVSHSFRSDTQCAAG